MWITLLFALLFALLAIAFVVWPLWRAPQMALVDENSELSELIQRKDVALASIREIEFDHQTGKLNTDDEYELTDEELVKDVYQDDTVEVGTWVREQILIELPPHPAHDSCSPPSLVKAEKTETKAKDPRLAGLEKFKIKE